MTKIALVANTTWNIYNFRLNIIRKLRDEGHEVMVFAPVDEYIFYKSKFPEVQHVPIRKLHRDSINPLHEIQLTIELVRLYRKHRPDLIVHYTVKPNIFGGLAARLAGVPSIAVVTGLGYAFIHNGLVKRTTKSLYRWSSRYHRKVVFENQDDKGLFIEDGLIDPAKAISVKGCGVDTTFFKPTGQQVPLRNGMANGNTDRTVFTFIGRLLYDKGIKEFIDAAYIIKQEHPQARFWIVGELDHNNPSAVRERDLMQWAQDSAITYHGPTHDVRQFLERSDCIVLPSYREGMSRVIMESMSMETPVITTDTAGCREAIDDGINGLLVSVGSAEALADGMRGFLSLSTETRHQMGVAGREKAIAIFDDKRVAEDIYGIIKGVLELTP